MNKLLKLDLKEDTNSRAISTGSTETTQVLIHNGLNIDILGKVIKEVEKIDKIRNKGKKKKAYIDLYINGI